MSLIETKKSYSESRKNKGRLPYGPIKTCHTKQLTFDDIIEMYSQQPSRKQMKIKVPKKTELTFESVMQEILGNEPIHYNDDVNNDLDVEVTTNNSKSALREIGNKKSSSKSKTNGRTLYCGPISTCNKKDLTFDEIIEMYSHQPLGNEMAKDTEITFKNIMDETFSSQSDPDDTVDNHFNIAASRNKLGNVTGGIVNNKVNSKSVKNGRSFCHGPISTCSKKELTFDEIIEMYTQQPLRKEIAKDVEITFEKVMDELFSSRPTSVNSLDNHLDIAASRNKLKKARDNVSEEESIKDTTNSVDDIFSEMMNLKSKESIEMSNIGTVNTAQGVQKVTFTKESKYDREREEELSQHTQEFINKRIFSKKQFSEQKLCGNEMGHERKLELNNESSEDSNNFYSSMSSNRLNNRKFQKSPYTITARKYFQQKEAHKMIRLNDRCEDKSENHNNMLQRNEPSQANTNAYTFSSRTGSKYAPYRQHYSSATSHIQDTLNEKLPNIETSQYKCLSDFPHISKNEVTDQTYKNSINLKSYDGKVILSDNYKPERRSIDLKPDKQVDSAAIQARDIEIPYKSLSFKTLVKILQDTEGTKSVNMLKPCEISKQEQPSKSDQSSFNRNFVSSSNKVAPSKDHKNNFESRYQNKEPEQPLEDFTHFRFFNEEHDRENLSSKDLEIPFNGKSLPESSLLYQPATSLTRSASKDFDSTHTHQKLKEKINLNCSTSGKNKVDQFSCQDVQVEVPLQCRPFSYLVDALKQSEGTIVSNNRSCDDTANKTRLARYGFPSKTDETKPGTLGKADIIFYSVPPVNHIDSQQNLPCPKASTTTGVCQEQNKQILEVVQTATTITSKTSKRLNVKTSEEYAFRNCIDISERPLENEFLVKDSESQSYSLSQPKCSDTTKQFKLDETAHDISSKLFNKEALQSIIETFRITQYTTRDGDCENNLGAENKTNFRKKHIRRYRRGKTKIFQITVACRKRKALTEMCDNNPSFDEIINLMSQTVENPGYEIEVVSLPRPASFETDASKSECLSTGSADNLETFEHHLRTGLNVISKDKSLLFSGSDYVLQSQDKDKIIMKIQEILLQVWEDMAANKSPQLTVRKQSYENCVFHDNMLQLKPLREAVMSIIHYKHSQSKVKFCLIMYLLNRIRILLETNTQLTKRELYYQLKNLIAKQGLIDSAINTISCLLDVGPWDLNILAQKGLVYGNLKIRFTSGNVLNCGIPGVLIPSNLDEIIEIESQSYFILVVEKEAIYHKLLQEDLPNRLTRPFILVTGKGFPDLNTQLFLKKLWIIMSIPVFIFVDGDFHGISIMLNYRYGSLKNAHLSQYLAIPHAKWIGVRPSEMVRLGITRQPLSDREKNLISNLMQSPYVAHNPIIKAELKILLDHGYKGGIEGLIKEQNYLSEMYLPYKFSTQDYI